MVCLYRIIQELDILFHYSCVYYELLCYTALTVLMLCENNHTTCVVLEIEVGCACLLLLLPGLSVASSSSPRLSLLMYVVSQLNY